MYAETGLIYPNFLNFSLEIQQLEELCFSQKPISSMDSMIPTSTISDYDLGGEGDLFKAPEAIIEEPVIGLDPMTAAISLIACGDDVMSPPGFEVCGMESLQNEQLLSDVFDGCRIELLEKASIETDVFDIKLPMTNEFPLSDMPFTKCCSSESLTSMEFVNGAAVRPNFLDFPDLDFEAANGMRRAFSEGDIKRSLVIGHCTPEARLQKLSRYRSKKSRRNFGRKIKYACRKALADSQPRIRGRFAKTEDSDCCRNK